MLPKRYPVGLDRSNGKIVTLKKYRGSTIYAASAFLPPAYTALYLAAYEKAKNSVPLPLFAYAALGFKKNKFVSTALRIDSDKRQECGNFNQDEIVRRGRSEEHTSELQSH